ncbi:hypothetical protein [Pedobacter namyangjuensis]|uniref:hypothetical protein n=1 Tax=Pedobacter namyangjuensis TaxID=600626 RepID=UPI000DE2BA01|nr:hypothetical protein [Pedobacter namyangjuensis]
MNKFVQGSELNASLEKLIKNAESILLLISPYIKLHSRIRDQLKLKKTTQISKYPLFMESLKMELTS